MSSRHAQDRADARAAVQASLPANARQECEACGEAIPAPELAAALLRPGSALHCASCALGLGLELRALKSPYCSLR